MAKETTYEEIARELKNRIYKPVYYLMGEESYYIDRISEYIAQTVLNENEKEFNQTIVYGADTDIATVINAAKRYPMMSKYQVVIVKEAQNIKNIEELAYYLQKPLDSTILVLCHKHGTLDRRKKLAAEIEKATGIETRATILGHMQRGGSPSCKDRVYASMMGSYAADLLCDGKSNRVVAYKDGKFVDYDIDEALAMQKDVDEHMYEVSKLLCR